jgi:hypothetical protein
MTTEAKSMTTYQRADRELIGGDYSFVTSVDSLQDDLLDEPVEFIEEVWERRSVRRFWQMPTAYSCAVEDGGEPCEEDAVGWWRSPDGVWLQACQRHGGDGADQIDVPTE